MTANIITLGRIILAFFVIYIFQLGFYWRIAAVVMTILVIYLDSLDGIVARKLGVASDFGALFDITGDRVVEHVYWIFFTFMGLVSFWVPVIFISRSFLVDTLRSVAFTKEGQTPFGEKSMMKSSLTHFLTASRLSRAVYGVSKLVAFVLLGLILVGQEGYDLLIQWLPQNFLSDLIVVTNILVWFVVALNLVRGIPVLFDGRFDLFDRYLPRQLKDEG